MNTFKKWNLFGGWFCFLFALIVYLLTMEPTASLWDCSEFIATSYKLEIGHPPGAPLFMMLSRLFAIFAIDPSHAAMMVNAMSCTASAATILFLFWSITHLAKRSYKIDENVLSVPQVIAIMGAGLIGAIAYTFTDTFWFSAIEGEVYALSSMFTAVVFWAILKWEDVADEPHANRWLVLIAYLTGLAIGVHLLNLLIIPAIVLIYYFKKYKATKWGVTKAVLLSFVILVAVLYIVIPKTIQLGAFFDRVFTNSFGLPVNVGITVYALALFGLLGWSIWYTHKKGRVILNTVMLCLTVIMIGYGSYASVIIRSAANPPMNSNSPNNPYGLLSLLNRDQYGSRPLVKGNYYSSPAVAIEEKTVYYVGDDGKYESAQTITGYKYAPGFEFFFPRMHSYKDSDIAAYHNWVDIKGRQKPFQDRVVTVPTFAENLQFFFAYQLNFMYWRYFLWNFVGRQSNIQSTGEITNGNWLSGINFIDQIFLGPQDELPSEMAQNKGRNRYYFLPFILGIIGLIFQLNRDVKNFWVVMTIFIMTGIAIAIYLNSPPIEPRERDYVFAGSFYAFAIWIGFGVLSLFQWISKLTKNQTATNAIIATAICAVVPSVLGAENWDDHDRSHRYVARDVGHNYLVLLPNSIVMNYGDNDTFPLWYMQEVEDFRHDVRVMNMSYLGGEWYIDQMKIKSNDSDPVPFSMPRSKYTFTNEFLFISDLFQRPIPIKQAIDFIISNDPRTQTKVGDKNSDFLPANKLLIPVNKENAIKSGIVKAEDAHLMVDTISIEIKKSSLDRGEMMLLDLLANFNWERPLYFVSSESLYDLGLRDYLQTDGFVYRLVPIYTPVENRLNVGRIDSELMYDNMMNNYKYGNVKDPRVYADNFVQYVYNSNQSRNLFARLANQLMAEGDTIRAIEVLDRGGEEFPFSQINHTYITTVPLIESYYMAGEDEKANAILVDYARILEEYVTYYLRFNGKKANLVLEELSEKAGMLEHLYKVALHYNQIDIARNIYQYFISKNIWDAEDPS